MKKKEYKKALEYFGKVHLDHRYYPEALLLTAQVHGNLNQFKQIYNVAEFSDDEKTRVLNSFSKDLKYNTIKYKNVNEKLLYR